MNYNDKTSFCKIVRNPKPFLEGLKKAATSAYNTANDMYNGLATEEQVIVHQFKNALKDSKVSQMLYVWKRNQ